VVLRNKVIRPLLAASSQLIPRPKLQKQTQVDQRYENLRDTMRLLFVDLGLAAVADRQRILHLIPVSV
jgi:hypothetical protein